MLTEVTKSNTVLIKLKAWRLLNEFTKLLVCFSVDRMYYILNNVGVLSLHQ